MIYIRLGKLKKNEPGQKV